MQHILPGRQPINKPLWLLKRALSAWTVNPSVISGLTSYVGMVICLVDLLTNGAWGQINTVYAATNGVLTSSVTVVDGSGGDTGTTNNSDSDKIAVILWTGTRTPVQKFSFTGKASLHPVRIQYPDFQPNTFL